MPKQSSSVGRGSRFGAITLFMMAASTCFVAPVDGQVRSWSQFRGDEGQGVVGDLQLPVTWSAEEGIVWRTYIEGRGHSSPVHDGRTIWLTTANRDGTRLGAISIDAESGNVLQKLTLLTPEAPEEIHHQNSYASPTPVLHAGMLFAHFGTYGTVCVDTATNDIVWQNTDFPVEHQGGPGSSPVLFEDVLILTLDGAQKQRLVGLNIKDGTVRWQRSRSAPLRDNPITHRAFSTPLLWKVNEQWQLLSPGADQLHAYDPRTGHEIWHVRYVGFSTVPCPVADEHRVYFCTGFFKPECWAVDPLGTGDVTETHLQWKFKGPVPETPSPILVSGKLFLVTNKGVLTCLDPHTGKREWVHRLGGNYSASPLATNTLIYFSSEEGEVKVFDPDSQKTIQINDMQEAINASPAVINGDLLIRTEAALYRITRTEPNQ